MKSLVIIMLLILTIFVSCKNNKSVENEQNNQAKIYFLNTFTATNPVNISCMNFVTTQNFCLITIDTGVDTCSDSSISKMMTGIEPSTNRTNEIISAFYSCWKKCNLIYNSQELTCSGSKFSGVSAYKTSQKTPTNQASVSWGSCMTKCNNGTNDEPNLKGTGATYPNYN